MEYYAELTKKTRADLAELDIDDVLLQLGTRVEDTENCIRAIIKNLIEVAYNRPDDRANDLVRIIKQHDCWLDKR